MEGGNNCIRPAPPERREAFLRNSLRVSIVRYNYIYLIKIMVKDIPAFGSFKIKQMVIMVM
jgi:hypothetical protein